MDSVDPTVLQNCPTVLQNCFVRTKDPHSSETKRIIFAHIYKALHNEESIQPMNTCANVSLKFTKSVDTALYGPVRVHMWILVGDLSGFTKYNQNKGFKRNVRNVHPP